ncbi:MAG TPA: radical SAM protein [Thermodesulfobacteriota bacterium]|nr:radical SAM protein [Thermodesulfobacteriota bacterium]
MAPLIIPIFLPAIGCRERCLFCNQKASSEGLVSPASVRNYVEASLSQIPYNKKNREKQVAFYGGSFTAIDRDDQVRYLKEVQPFLASGLVDSIRVSTRPDALDAEILSLLREHGVTTIEVGVQSMIDEVLSLALRGHRADDTASATVRLKQWGFQVGHQLMIGLPGDTRDRFLQTLDRIIELEPDFVRIHPTLVLRGAPLENLWREGRYSPLSLEETIDWLRRGVVMLEKSSTSVARIGLQPTDQLEGDFLAGPYHPALRQFVDGAIFFDMAASLLQTSQKSGQTLFYCHPKDVSNLRGQRNENILKLKKLFNLSDIFVNGRQELPRGYLGLQTQREEVSIHRKSLSYQEIGCGAFAEEGGQGIAVLRSTWPSVPTVDIHVVR